MNHVSTGHFTQFQYLAERFTDEVITTARVKHVEMPHQKTLALLTLDNDGGPRRPLTLGPNSLIRLGEQIAQQRALASQGKIHALAIIGKPGFFVAGADLTSMKYLSGRQDALNMAQLGHAVYDLLVEFPVPTFAFINGVALGGGLELALACQYRTISSSAGAVGLPEIYLGLIPGWGGVHALPHLIGPEASVKVIVKNPLYGNRSCSGTEAFDLGIADYLVEEDRIASQSTVNFLDESLKWASLVLEFDSSVCDDLSRRRDRDGSAEAWQRAISTAHRIVANKTGGHVPAPAKVLQLLEHAQTASRKESADHQCKALEELLVSHEFANTIYAFLEILQKRSKNPARAPGLDLALPIRKVGIIGAGLMARQLAQLFVQRLHVPVILLDRDDTRTTAGVEAVQQGLNRSANRGTLQSSDLTEVQNLVSGSTDYAVLTDADFVIEAVFEELETKQQVLTQVESVVAPSCVLASNTSSLSIAEIASGLKHPERMVGFHFFNPVSVMPLLELIEAPQTSPQTLSTAFCLAIDLGKTPVLVQDATAFVVNRILLRLLGEIQRCFDQGTDAHTVDHALDHWGLPMSPFSLLAMVGLPVAQHVTKSLNQTFGNQRFPVSKNIDRLIEHGKTAFWAKDDPSRESSEEVIPEDIAQLLQQDNHPIEKNQIEQQVADALAEEIGLMLEEGVVADIRDIDLCLILGAGWPLHLGGISPFLDQQGATQRMNSTRFHEHP